MIYFVITLIFYILYLWARMRKALHMLQQNSYETGHYFKWMYKNAVSVFLTFDVFIFLPIAFAFWQSKIIYILIGLVYLILFVKTTSIQKKEQVKKPLNYTSRIKRLVVTFLIITGLILTFIILNFAENDIIIYYLILGLYGYLIYFIIMLCNIINYPIEKIVYFYYLNKSDKKLKSMLNLKVIGVTGSYGKTSTKNILATILSEKYRVLASPKSYNTPYGLMRTVNENIDKFDQIFIAEIGAVKLGDLNSRCRVVHPQYGIITKIGVAHLETFKTIENITKTKFHLIDCLPKDGVGVLNKDDEIQKEYYKNGNKKVLWIGIKESDVDVRASNIDVTYEGMNFDVTFKGDKEKYEFKTQLLGEANVYNILSSLALAKELGVNVKQMQAGVKKLRSVEHRLELKQSGDITIIDDAFNSNPVGSKMALDVLSRMPGKRIIVTPGMIELGEEEEEYNKEFGRYMKGKADAVILVGEKQTKPIYNGLKETGFKKENIYVLNDLKKAFNLIQALKDKKTYVLLENDLPDIFNERDK